ncbi:MAG TPA: FAD-dependent oxidoreductase, partial [Acidimicrobiales bacterium]|nr:FAD-dependent oxidoreductase [Acidimicrobiales bacterium]
MKVVVVGAGLGGLSAACHLVGRGHDVEVLERADVPGGRAGLWHTDGYKFDTGPSVLTMRDILAGAFNAAGAEMDSHLTLKPVDPMYRACFADGSAIHVRHGREAMVEEIRTTAGATEAAGFVRFCDYLTGLYELELPNFIDRNFDNVLDIARPPWPLFTLVKMGGLRRLSNVVNGFFKDPRLQKLFSFQAMYAGLSPFEALALYCVITYMDTVEGV